MVLATYVQSFENGEVTGYDAPAGRITIVNEPAAQEPVGYTDVTEANWYYEAVTYVTEKGLMAGKTDTTFAPSAAVTGADLSAALKAFAPTVTVEADQTVTRAELVTLLWNYVGKPAAEADLSAFTDGAAVSAANQPAVIWAVAQGLLQGSNGALDLDSQLTRAQAATLIVRLLALYQPAADQAA